MFKKTTLIFLFIFSSQAAATGLPVLRILALPQEILTAIDSGISAVSDGIQEAHQAIVATEAIQTTINTYDNLMEVMKVYNKTVQLYNIVTGNPGFSSFLRVAGDRDVRNVMGESWSNSIDSIGGAANTFSGTDRRIRAAMRRFEDGNVPYNSDLVYIDPKFFKEKESYDEKLKRNKTYAVLAQASLDRAEENIEALERMELKNDIITMPKERDSLRNAILIRQNQAQIETNNALERLNSMQNDMIIEETQRRAQDIMIANSRVTAW